MKKELLKLFLLLLLASHVTLYTFNEVAASIYEKAGTVGAQFLKIGVGARPAALGDSYGAVTGDANTLFWNPAGMADIDNPVLSLYHNRWIAGINRQSVAFAYPTPWGVWGGGLQYLYMDELIGRDEDGEESIPRFKSYNMAALISYSQRIDQWIEAGAGLRVGLNFKIIYEQIAEASASGFALDIGGLFAFGERWSNFNGLTAGFSVKNLGTKLKLINESYALPLNLKLGLAYRFFSKKAMATVDINKFSDTGFQMGWGFEYQLYETLQVRAGYFKKEDLGKGIRLGMGFKIGEWSFDYAYVPMGKLEDTHRMNLNIRFGQEKKRKMGQKQVKEEPRATVQTQEQEGAAVRQVQDQSSSPLEMDTELERVRLLRQAVEGLMGLILNVSQ